MNKEKIKEVIDNLNGVVKGIYRMDEAGLEIEDIEIILNYITNLQEENKELKELEHDYRVELKLTARYEKRIDKALDKLYCYGEAFDRKILKQFQKEMENILKGIE